MWVNSSDALISLSLGVYGLEPFCLDSLFHKTPVFDDVQTC